MPWPVYSERIMHHSAPGSWTYTVPDEMRVVLKYLSATSFQSVVSVVQVQIKGIACYHRQFPASGGAVQVDLFAVAYQGDVITLYMSHSEMVCHLSGFIFADETGHTGPPQALEAGVAAEAPAWEPWPGVTQPQPL